MNWISIGMVAGSIVVGQHDTKESCLGRVEILKEQKIVAKCTEAPGVPGFIVGGSGVIGGMCMKGSGLWGPC